MAKKKQSELNKLNETGARENEDRRQDDQPIASNRRKVSRRRQIDPTTCERDYSDPEIEFMQALDTYKRENGRMFPTCSEILEVIKKLGYQKVGESNSDECNESESDDTCDSSDMEANMEDTLDSLEELAQ